MISLSDAVLLHYRDRLDEILQLIDHQLEAILYLSQTVEAVCDQFARIHPLRLNHGQKTLHPFSAAGAVPRVWFYAP